MAEAEKGQKIPKMEDAASDDVDSTASSSTGSDHDDDWNDWVDDNSQALATRSLFADSVFESPDLALQFDKDTHGFDLVAFCAQLGLDTHQRIRLVNYIRSQKAEAAALKELQGTEPLFSDDTYLKPVIEDDPLLQLQADDWSESEEEFKNSLEDQKASKGTLDQTNQLRNALREARNLKERLTAAQQELDDYRTLVNTKIADIAARELGSDTIKEIREEPAPRIPDRDDDKHYFESYAEHNIHWVMLTDTVRTSTYATFILSNPLLFRDAVVMDVGCGTGILSLFAARAGAKKVFAVEASKIADKAEAIFKASGYGDTITLIRGKVESISLPEEFPRVDVIISEWMGYALLYESMLDSVLVARDRFLKPMGEPTYGLGDLPQQYPGVMAPSQCRMILALGDPKAIIKQRIGFWRKVYGFDMSAMAAGIHEEAIVDCVSKDEILSTQCIVKDLNLQSISPNALSFTSPFQLNIVDFPTSPTAKAAKIKSGQTYYAGKLHEHRTYATAFILWFETFFHPEGKQYDPEDVCKVHTGEGEWETGDVLKLRPNLKRKKTGELGKPDDKQNDVAQEKAEASVSPKVDEPAPIPVVDTEKAREESFTTGPHGTQTHWKQTIFLLKTPIELNRGTEVKGTFHCRKSPSNSRELDVEFHYTIGGSPEGNTSETQSSSPPTIQCFRVC